MAKTTQNNMIELVFYKNIEIVKIIISIYMQLRISLLLQTKNELKALKVEMEPHLTWKALKKDANQDNYQ